MKKTEKLNVKTLWVEKPWELMVIVLLRESDKKNPRKKDIFTKKKN